MSSENAASGEMEISRYLELEHIKILPWNEAEEVRNSLRHEPHLVMENYASGPGESVVARTKIFTLLGKLLRELSRDGDLVAAEWMIQELVINAFKDGNKMDKEKWVRLGYGIRNSAFMLFVCDEGAGFHPYRVDNPLHPEWLGKEDHGRGLICIDAFTGKLRGSTKYLPMAPGMNPDDGHTRCRELLVDLPLDGETPILVKRFREEYAKFEMPPQEELGTE